MTSFNKIALTFDIEDWFCVKNMEDVYPVSTWDQCEIRIEEGTYFILEQLKKRKIKATFFILGRIAEFRPRLIKEIARLGHEIATHGYSHQSLDKMTPVTFAYELKKSISILRQITQKEVIGHRAPNFSLTPKTLWAVDIMREAGLVYDSSIYPGHSFIYPSYGHPKFEEKNFREHNVVEFPIAVLDIFGLKLPIAGGGIFRLLPYPIYQHLLTKKTTKQLCVLYFHPWEFDPHQPRVALPIIKRFKHYNGLDENRKKFEALLDYFPPETFTTLKNALYKTI